MRIGPSFRWCALLLALLLLLGERAAAQEQPLLERLVSFFGLNADPSQMRGPGEGLRRGEIWIADLASGTKRRLTSEKKFRSPIFLPGGDILALDGEKLVRIPGAGGAASTLRSVQGADKLVAVSATNPSQILLIRRDNEGSPVPSILGLKGDMLTPVDMDWRSENDVRGLAYLEGWDRDYEGIKLRVQRMRAAGFSGMREWTDVVLIGKGREPENVSGCREVDCGQPSLSLDRAKVVFIKDAH